MAKRKIKFKLDINGLDEVMKSEGMQEKLKVAGEAVVEAAMYGTHGKQFAEATGTEVEHGLFGSSVHLGDYTALANVYPIDATAILLGDNSLLRALGAAGLSLSKRG